jgi:pimeloyl-ACP methyl ester carboxylesterase
MFARTTFAQETIVYLHGLNANIKSNTYSKYLQHLKNDGTLIAPSLPGHENVNQLDKMNKESITHFFNNLINTLEMDEGLSTVTIYAHSMAAILFRNYIHKDIREKFKQIFYLSPGVPPKYFSFFKFIIDLLPDKISIPSYSPQNLRLNNQLPLATYKLLFNEVDKFIITKKTLPNEKILVHQKDEVVDVDKLTSLYPQAIIMNGKSLFPYHVFFLR